MKKPSKKHARIDELNDQKKTLLEQIQTSARTKQKNALKSTADRLVQLEQEIAEAEESDDEYTCVVCEEDFPPGLHTDILAACIVIHTPQGVIHRDFGYGDGRRIIFCPKCSPVNINAYVDAR